LLFELPCVDFLNLCHDVPFPALLEYISALGTLPNRGKVSLDAHRESEPGVERLYVLPRAPVVASDSDGRRTQPVDQDPERVSIVSVRSL